MGRKVLAIDLGASSGRAVLGNFNGERLTLSEVYRFTNEPVLLRRTLYWDFLRLLYEIEKGISMAVQECCGDLTSFGIDTWGVDFGLLDKKGRLIENPIHYRDRRTDGMQEKVFQDVIPRAELYRRTGTQMMNLNTVFQLYSLVVQRPEILEYAENLLFMADLILYFLTGERTTEYTLASTAQLLNLHTGNWDFDLIAKLGFSRGLFGTVTRPGTSAGRILPELCEELGIPAIKAITVTEHDTAAAILATPMEKGKNCAYLSCGTWSLLGIETKEPFINENTLALNYTNEGGYGEKVNFFKNIIGLWLMQECRRQWEREGEKFAFSDIDRLTARAEPLQAFIDPDSTIFIAPGDMPARIAAFCAKTRQKPPQGKGEFSRCITDSLALKYRQTFEELELLYGKKIDMLHVIGGGVKDQLLCQCTANAIHRPVAAGPVEATAIGDIMVQLIACGEISGREQARELIARSFPVKIYEPQDTALWDCVYKDYLHVLQLESNNNSK